MKPMKALGRWIWWHIRGVSEPNYPRCCSRCSHSGRSHWALNTGRGICFRFKRGTFYSV